MKPFLVVAFSLIRIVLLHTKTLIKTIRVVKMRYNEKVAEEIVHCMVVMVGHKGEVASN